MIANQSVVDLFKKIADNKFGFFDKVKSVSDLLDTEIPTASHEHTLGQIIGRADVRTISSRGVIDADDGELIGVVKSSTLLRCSPRYLNTLAEKESDTSVLRTRVAAIVTRPAVHLAPSAAPLEAIDIFLNRDCDCVFVYDDPKAVVGVVQPVDFVRTMLVYYEIQNQTRPLQRLRLIDLDEMQLDEIFFCGAQTARDIMQPLITLDEGEPVLAAVKAMHDNNTSVVGLMDRNETATNVLTAQDVLVGQRVPENILSLCNPNEESNPVKGLLDLLSWNDLLVSDDPVLSDSAKSLASIKASVVEPTTRAREVLAILAKSSPNHVILVKSGAKVEGVITVREVLRIFKTLLKIQAWNR